MICHTRKDYCHARGVENIIALYHRAEFFLSLVKFLFVNSHNVAQSKFKPSWWRKLASVIMENVKQIMSDVDAYMTKLIESIELIETGDFPHSEGQFFIRYFGCLLLIVKRKKFVKVVSGSIAEWWEKNRTFSWTSFLCVSQHPAQ